MHHTRVVALCYRPYFFDEAKIGLSSQMDFFID